MTEFIVGPATRGATTRTLAVARRTVLLAVLAALVVTGTATTARDASAANMSVRITDFAYAPSSINVTAGDSVAWRNDDAEVPHTVTSDAGSFESGTLHSGGTFSWTFTDAGTYRYHCAIHPGMTGTVVVAGAVSPTVPASPTTPATATPTTADPTPAASPTRTAVPSTPATVAVAATAAPAAPATGTGGGSESSLSFAILATGVALVAGAATVYVVLRRCRTP